MSDAVREHTLAFLEGFVVILCIIAAGLAPQIKSATTELFVGSLVAGALCSASIFLTSEIGQALSRAGRNETSTRPEAGTAVSRADRPSA